MVPEKSTRIFVTVARVFTFVLSFALFQAITEGTWWVAAPALVLGLAADAALLRLGGARGREIATSTAQTAVVWAYGLLTIYGFMLGNLAGSQFGLVVVMAAFIGIAFVSPFQAGLFWAFAALGLTTQLNPEMLFVFSSSDILSSRIFAAPALLGLSAAAWISVALSCAATGALAIYVRRIRRSTQGWRSSLGRLGVAALALAYASVLAGVLIWYFSIVIVEANNQFPTQDRIAVTSLIAAELRSSLTPAQIESGAPEVAAALAKGAEDGLVGLTIVDGGTGAVIAAARLDSDPGDPNAPAKYRAVKISPQEAFAIAQVIKRDLDPEITIPANWNVASMQVAQGLTGPISLVVTDSYPEWWAQEGTNTSEQAAYMFAFVFPWVFAALLLPASLALLALERRDVARAELLFAQERARLSRDAHDRVYNRMTALAGRLETGAEAGGPPPADEIRGAVADLQRILGDVDARGTQAHDVGAGLFDDVVADQARRWGMAVTLEGQEALAGLDPRLAWELQCVVEEALTNAGRHGHAKRVTVSVARADHALRIEVVDDGTGIAGPLDGDGLPSDASGLRGISDRLKALGGTMALSADGPSGTKVAIEVPV